MHVWVLIGEGANDLQIPALIFGQDEQEALAHCTKILGENFKYTNDRYRWRIEEEDSEDDDDDNDEEYSVPRPFNELYTDYYGGCGDCYAAILKKVEVGKPFVQWNLD